MRVLLFLLLLLEINPNFILDRLRQNTKVKSVKFDAVMEIKRGNRILTKKFYGYGREDDFLLIFTNPEDRDVKYLKLKNELFIYLPDIDDVVRISGDMLKHSLAGSDLSYEDLMTNDPFGFYGVELEGDTVFKEHEVYIINLVDTTGKAPYYEAKLYVDRKRFIPWKEEFFTRSGRKIKETEALSISKFGSRYYITDLIMRDLRRKDSSTRFTFKNLNFDIEIPEEYFKREILFR